MPFWARAIVVVGGAKTVLGVTAYLSGLVQTTVPSVVPGWIYALLALAYLLLGAFLLVANRSDIRAAWLGSVFVLVSAPLAPVVNASASVFPSWIIYFRPEALLPWFLWLFVLTFPGNVQARGAGVIRLVSLFVAVAGFGCLTINMAAAFGWSAGVLPLGVWETRFLFSTRPGNLYWPLVMGLEVPAFPVLLWRGRLADERERRRVQRFVRALLIGCAPITIEVVLEELLPGYKAIIRRPPVENWMAIAIFVPLATVPFTAAYCVLFEQVVETRVVLRLALQHALARYTVLGLAVVPFAALALFVVAHRDEALVSLLSGPRPLTLGAAVLFGLTALSRRHLWIDAVDRRYFREAYDAQQILTRFVHDLPERSALELAEHIRRELENSLHADAGVFLVNDAQSSLRDVSGRWAPLAVDSALVSLMLGDQRSMDIDLGPGSALGRLSAPERAWLAQGPFKLVVALRRTGGGISGVVALCEKRSGLDYTDRDRHLVTAVAAAASLALDNLRLVTPHTPVSEPAARECLECSQLNPPDALRCSCGGLVTDAAAPHVLRGIFRLEQRIGMGGMGVVYRAVDLTLGRTVAIKTLPRVDAAGAERLRREARAMATMIHPNLAVIHGLETWQGTPFLVEEYLSGGTLSHRLASSTLSVAESLDLGCTLAAVLGELHSLGVVHCDIKPSNIGFTRGGVVKLLDFGLSRLLRGVLANPEALTERPAADLPWQQLSATGPWAGTPSYMSPEAAHGASPTPGFDTWALSVVLFEAISGRRPFEGRNASEVFDRLRDPCPDIRQFRPECPAVVAAFFERALAPDQATRPSTAGSLRNALESLRRDIAIL